MKVSCNWLRDYVDVPRSPQELSHALTMSGLEVDEMETHGAALDGVIVGHIQEVRPHPNADRLTVCQVDVGTDAPVQIVCGAPNVAEDQKAPVAPVGVTLMLPSRAAPGNKTPVKIRKAKLCGEASAGMICAEDELGLSDDHTGIMVLDADAQIGQPLEKYLELSGAPVHDTVLDIAITPNRPDAVCHIGVARDVAAVCGEALRRPDVRIPEQGGEAGRAVSVEIACPDACRRYVAVLVRHVAVRPSPLWLRRRLEAVGSRPINNVVDITNFVMRECGQPLHAFDFDNIAGSKIIVRQAHGPERFTTLDGKDHTLPSGAVLICDAKRPIALGGVMGGANSEVEATTTNVLIESAYFDPSLTRKAAKALGIATDASYRFERGVDAQGQAWAAARAAALMVELCDAALVPGMVDAHPNPVTSPVLQLRLKRLAKILGAETPPDEVVRILTALGFRPAKEDAETLRCSVPSFRPDVEREIDLIEEVARIYGFDKIPESRVTPLRDSAPGPRPRDVLRAKTHAILGGRGYREIYTNSLLSRTEAELFCHPVLGGAFPVVETLNAVSQAMTTLRPSLLPGALAAMQFNQNHGQESLRFYEFGHVFHRTSQETTYVPGYAEHEAFVLAASGRDAPPGWDRKARTVDFFDLKGDVETLLEELRVPGVWMLPLEEPTPLTAYGVTVFSEETSLGCIARLSDAIQTARDVCAPLYFAELNWTLLLERATPNVSRRYQAIGRHPVVERDIAVIVASAEPVGAMINSIREAGRPLLLDVGVFDLYKDESIGSAFKSVAFSLRFGAARTLRDEEVDNGVEAIVRMLAEAHTARLRR